MRKRVYIRADYSEDSADRNVVETLNQWETDNLHKVDFVDMAKVVSGSISNGSDCRPCDLKLEFNNQINASSAVIIVIGDKTASRMAGCNCSRMTKIGWSANVLHVTKKTNGLKPCKVYMLNYDEYNVSRINSYSYIRHKFEQAKKRKKSIIVIYNLLNYI